MAKTTFTLFWLDGKREVVAGTDIAGAMNTAGYGRGALRALDFWASGDNIEYDWDAADRRWTKRRAA